MLAVGRTSAGPSVLAPPAGAASTAVTVGWSTADGTASGAKGDDVAASGSGSVTFAPGSTTATVVVTVVGDKAEEADETVVLRVTGAGGATGSGPVLGLAPALIPDDDPTTSHSPGRRPDPPVALGQRGRAQRPGQPRRTAMRYVARAVATSSASRRNSTSTSELALPRSAYASRAPASSSVSTAAASRGPVATAE